MMLGKRKLQNKTVSQKYNALKDLEKGLSNKEVAAKYGVPKNTLSTWVKNKQKIFSTFEQSKVTAKRKKLRTGAYDDVDQAVFKWFNSKRSQQIPIDGPMLKEKAIDFAKARNQPDFKSFRWMAN